jgi:anti-anti-sigma factor
MRREQLEINPAPLGDAPGVSLAGEIDIAVAEQLRVAIDDGIRESSGAYVVDVTDIEFLDSSGVGVFVRARALLGREERDLVVICPPGPAHRIFEVAGILDLLSPFESRDAASAALVPVE